MRTFRFALKTFGCKVNQYEEQLMREGFVKYGWEETGTDEADVLVVNSCTVTGQAEVKARRYLKRVKRDNPDIRIFFTGCYAVLPEDIRTLNGISEIHSVIPGGEKGNIVPMIVRDLSGECVGAVNAGISGFGTHTRAFIKVQDGCDQKCAYCKVNIVRGPSRSRGIDEIVAEVERLLERGYREMVITGICLGLWRGNGGERLDHLLREILRIKGRYRIRLSSLEPNHVDEELLDVLSGDERLCRHLHIPLQSGSDHILGAMGRRYTVRDYARRIEHIRKVMPSAGITMDVISSFPGETEDDHRNTRDFLHEISPSRLHVFRFSERPGTKAASMSFKVPVDVAKQRVNELIELGEGFKDRFCRSFIGTPVDVLLEKQEKGGMLEGYTGEYVRVVLSGYNSCIGDIIRVTPTKAEKRIEPSLICAKPA
ncbi:MAG: tRNA (N(6)-L-threonylcarbamoyladenosine(37)-C(2))-methylthiotransferase MtaB [Candidatus Omnitrophica bacterium]|nr:tRNA (N(6)-L-threonylcarbamoyladenosine(37)-C(2))-methylthiotransferase MtaB [Candidatus Omnitrophota bacterium]MDD5487952.1 tRNA (N(6)-L-threonylcarbamoyladenosine(37)-C(2))-methylthiotransferase MtaB [Candidatus Omnitrophota bacterium]